MNRLVELLKNKYFIVIIAFAIWMMFFDKNDMLSQYDYRVEGNKLQAEKDFFTKETAIVKKDLAAIDSNMNTAEKYAREKYFMKKDNEDIFIIVKENKKED